MAETNLGSADPASAESLAGVMEFAIKKTLQGIDGQLPARIIAYDRNSNRATVQPLISRVTTAGQAVERATIASVPVVAMGGGEFNISFPLKAGDRGWIEASDRDISIFLQTDDVAKPNTLRMHNFADGRFIPDVFDDFTPPADSDDALVIQHKDGNTFVSVKEKEVRMKVNETEVKMDENSITFTAGGQSITLSASGFAHNGVNSGATHIHGGVQRGDGQTDGPQ